MVDVIVGAHATWFVHEVKQSTQTLDELADNGED